MSDELAGVLSRASLTGVWAGKEMDEKTTNEVHESHGSEKDTGEWRSDLFPVSACGENNPHKVWVSACWKLRAYHYKYTLPWEKPLRLVTSQHHEKYDSEVNRLWAVAEEAGRKFFLWYKDRGEGSWWERVKRAANGGFNPKLYRDPASLEGRFGFSLNYTPISYSHHFCEALAGPAIERARQQCEQRVQLLRQEAIAHAWREVLVPIMKLTERLADPEVLVREDVVTGIRETLERVPAINLNNDPALSQCAEQIRQALVGVTAAGLRDSPVLRLETAKQTMAVLKTFGNLGGGRKFA